MGAAPDSSPGIAQILLGIFLLTVAGVLLPMGFVAAFLDEFPPFRGTPIGHFLGGTLFFGLAALSLVWGLLCFRRRRTATQLAQTSRGWKALGALFLMLALVPVAVGTVRLLTFGTDVDLWIAEAQLIGRLVNRHAKMRMRFDRLVAADHCEPAAHAQMKDKVCHRREFEDHPLGTAVNADDPSPGQELGEWPRVAVDDVWPFEDDAGQDPAGKPAVELAGNRFDFG